MSGPDADFAERDFTFDENWYLQAYPDIARAVHEGVVSSALVHYVKFGRDEGRLPSPFDAQWYARAYPLAAQETGSTDAGVLYQHYVSVGRFRGYLAYPSAERPRNAARICSDFGGLWIDHANAADLIAGKYEIGQIDRRDASMLNSLLTHGYVKLSGAVPTVLVYRAEEALDDGPGGYKSASESARYGSETPGIVAAVSAHERGIVTEGQSLRLKREAFIAKRGDVLFWHANLAHGGAPISSSRSRKSVVTHYCPREVAPLYFENGVAAVRQHGPRGYYSSGIYPHQSAG